MTVIEVIYADRLWNQTTDSEGVITLYSTIFVSELPALSQRALRAHTCMKKSQENWKMGLIALEMS